MSQLSAIEHDREVENQWHSNSSRDIVGPAEESNTGAGAASCYDRMLADYQIVVWAPSPGKCCTCNESWCLFAFTRECRTRLEHASELRYGHCRESFGGSANVH